MIGHLVDRLYTGRTLLATQSGLSSGQKILPLAGYVWRMNLDDVYMSKIGALRTVNRDCVG